MRPALDATHDPALRSWVDSANAPGTDFPVQNLPFGVFADDDGGARVGVAIGDRILDLRRACTAGWLEGLPAGVEDACGASDLRALLALGRPSWSALRARLSERLRAGAPARPELLVAQRDVALRLPAAIGDYTDFYASIHHATRVGRLFRPDNPLLPNYKHVPIGYHGRASSIVPSGAPVRRPRGQRKPPDADAPVFGPSQLLDYELEVGCLVGPGNALGEPIAIERAEEHAFGLCLLNDWSARDVQAWEYQPLGPFLAKSFATTISPWVVTLEALAPYRCAAFARPAGDPAPLPYLTSADDAASGGVDLALEVLLRTERMRRDGLPAVRLSRGSLRDMYWSFAQMLTHHASNGCNLRPGDLLASGTVSGPEPESRGCLLELTSRGAEPVELPNGERRRFLEDGDEVLLRGVCERPGCARIGFGECAGVVLPARED
jgi:fumarylacetoacetase